MESRTNKSIPALDGVRGIAITLVVCSHIGSLVTGAGAQLPSVVQLIVGFGFSGVDLFFVLSGFLLFMPYVEAIVDGRALPSTRRFFQRRARRILPAYFAVLVVILALLSVQLAAAMVPGCHITLGGVLSGVTLLYDMVPQAYCVYTVMDGPLWSLTVEWQFYIVLPLLCYVMWRIASARGWRMAIPCGLVAMSVYSFAVDIWAVRLHYQMAPGKLSVPMPWEIPYALLFGTNGKYLGAFALGMAASLVYVRCRGAWSERPRRERLTLVTAALVAAAVLIVSLVWATEAGKIGVGTHYKGMLIYSIVFPVDASRWAWGVWGDWLICAAYAILVILVLFVPVASRLVAFAPLRYLGKISYSVYLWHLLFFNFLHVLMTQPGSAFRPQSTDVVGWTLLVLALLAAIVAWGSISYFVIERPFLRKRDATAPTTSHAAAMEVTG